MKTIAIGLSLLLVSCAGPAAAPMMAQDGKAVKYARFEAGGTVQYGVVEGDRIRAIAGDLFGSRQKTDKVYSLGEVKLLAPVVAPKVFALGGNYKSHLGDKPPFAKPELFFKLPTSVVGPGADIVIPPG